MSENPFIRQTLALTSRELKHWYRRRMHLVIALVQPLIWLGILGKMLSATVGTVIPIFFTVFALGMVMITALTTAMSSGMSLIWDRRSGFLEKMCVAPISRSAIPLSRILATTVKSVIQCTIVFIVGLALGMQITAFGIWSIPVALLAIIGVSFIFSTVFITFGMLIRAQEVFMGVNILFLMPLILVSGALLPLGIMNSDGALESILITLAKCNPLTWASDALRAAFMSDSALHPLGPSWPSILALPDLTMGMNILILTVTAIAVTVWGMVIAKRALAPK